LLLFNSETVIIPSMFQNAEDEDPQMPAVWV